MNKKPSYVDSFEEIVKIIASLEQGDLTVDELHDCITRMAQLIRVCKSKLDSIDETLESILNIMKEPRTSE
jgi:exodeoxyribonuclease VII small subunit